MPSIPSLRDLAKWDTLDGSRAVTSASLSPQNFTAARCIIAFYAFSVWIWVWASSDHPHAWAAYLTNWTFMSITFHFLLSATLTVRRYLRDPDSLRPALLTSTTEAGNPSCKWERILYIWSETVFVTAWVVVVLYWGAEVPTDPDGVDVAGLPSNLHVHLMTGFWATADLWMSRVLFMRSHIFFIIAYLLTYLLFNGVYAAISHALYSILKWNSFFSVAVIIGAIILTCLLFFIGSLCANKRAQKFESSSMTTSSPPVQLHDLEAEVDSE